MSYLVEQKPSLEELAHAGVKGMHWGVRKSPEKAAQKAHLKQLNKESKARDNASMNKEIDAARQRLHSGQARKEYMAAKAQYKIDKNTIGKREALKKFNEVRNKNLDDQATAQLAKSGRETTVAVLGIVGTMAAAVVLHAVAGGMQNRRL